MMRTMSIEPEINLQLKNCTKIYGLLLRNQGNLVFLKLKVDVDLGKSSRVVGIKNSLTLVQYLITEVLLICNTKEM